jgi:hypothetical protein
MSAPPAVPALPDTQRLTSYSISAATGPFNVNFAIYGDGGDYDNWIEVWLNDVRLNSAQYILTSPTGPITDIPRPISDGQIMLATAGTGTLVIIGARRPRRITQFAENQGVPARDLNQVLTDIFADQREAWDFARTRSMYFPGGETVTTLLPIATTRANKFLSFDGSGNPSLLAGTITGTTATLALSTTRAQIPTVTLPANTVIVSGFAAAGDLGAGAIYTSVGAGPSGPMAIQDLSGTWFNLVNLNRTANVYQWGAKGDGVTDDTTAVQNAINWAITVSGCVLFGAGSHRFAAGSAALNPGAGNIDFEGAGPDATILLFEDGSNTKNLFLNTTSTLKGSLAFRGLQIKGQLAENGYVAGGGSAIVLNYYAKIVIEDCKFYDLSGMATQCEAIQSVRVVNNHFELIAIDQVRFRSSFNCIVMGNYFKNGGDDAIALHQANFITGTNIREGLVVANNILEDACAIKCLGARMVTIQNNVLRRPKGIGIWVAGDPAEGDDAIFSISVRGNQIFDQLGNASPGSAFASAAFTAIQVQSNGPQSGGAVIPGENNTATGAFVTPYATRNNAFSGGGPMPPLWNIDICDNTIARTLPAGAYASWGYGNALTNPASGGFVNPTLTDTTMRPTNGIILEGTMRSARIQGNTIACCNNAVGFSNSIDSFSLLDVTISNNLFFDIDQHCINTSTAGGTVNSKLVVANNTFDLDPYHINSNRAANGKWAALGSPIALWASFLNGVQFLNNQVRNSCRIGYSNNGIFYQGNILHCNPVNTGFDANNQGIGEVPSSAGGRDFIHYITDSDPTSATYGQTTTIPSQIQSNMPSTGKYVLGYFVYDGNFANGNLGYFRQTTGSAHVLGTDWRKVVYV